MNPFSPLVLLNLNVSSYLALKTTGFSSVVLLDLGGIIFSGYMPRSGSARERFTGVC